MDACALGQGALRRNNKKTRQNGEQSRERQGRCRVSVTVGALEGVVLAAGLLLTVIHVLASMDEPSVSGQTWTRRSVRTSHAAGTKGPGWNWGGWKRGGSGEEISIASARLGGPGTRGDEEREKEKGLLEACWGGSSGVDRGPMATSPDVGLGSTGGPASSS